MTALKIVDAGGSVSHAPRPRRHTEQWLYYVWGDHKAIAEPVGDNEPAARRMLEGLIALYRLPPDGTWYRGEKRAVLP